MSRRRRDPRPPSTIPEEMPPPRSRYNRPRRVFSNWGIMIGLILGISGGLVYAWAINPVVQFSTEPWQLRQEDRNNYMAAVALAFTYDSDLNRAIQRLLTLQHEGQQADLFQQVADAACRLATTGYVDSNAGLRALRNMRTFYQLQGRTGCADTLIPDLQPTTIMQIEASTPTLPPPASKTPTSVSEVNATPTPPRIIVSTVVPQRDFVLADVNTFCNSEFSGVIEVFVQDFGGVGIPGQSVRARWDGGQDTFFTGLKPERGPGYGDFQMEEGKGYILEMPGRSDPSANPLTAVTCVTPDTGERVVISYRVFFLPAS